MFDRREHRRDLLDLAAKRANHLRHRGLVDANDRTSVEYLAVRIAAVGAYAELDSNPILLVRVEQELRKLRCLAETQWQYAGREGIEASRVTDLLRAIQLLRALHRIVRTHSARFVDDD